jgi:signal transduction histidine kinase
MSLLALPALTSGRDPQAVVQILLSSLEAILPVELVYCTYSAGGADTTLEVLRVRGEDLTPRLKEYRPYLEDVLAGRKSVVIGPFGELKSFFAALGHYGHHGKVLLGSPDRRFPRPTELILLQAATSLASAGLENARLVHESRAASRAKDEFLAMLGHELRNPLSPIMTALQLLKLRSGAGREIEIIERQAQRLVLLVDDLMDISRITRGMVVLHKETLELAAIVASAVEAVSPLITQRRHALRVDVPQQGLRVRVDPMRLTQVVSNLLTNAAKYTEPGGTIELFAERSGENVVFTVKDDGMGIAPELLPNIFDIFVQGRPEIHRPEGGLGIGLALVKNLAQLHGGSVQVASAGTGKGSTFRVSLPIATDGPPTVVPGAQHAGTTATRCEKVLIVDDNVDSAELMAELLRNAGHEVVVVHDGAEGFRAMSRVRPTVAILDIGLPGMDGYELATRTRESFGEDAPKMIALTGYGQPDDRRRSSCAGFAHHLVKPVNFEELLEAIA